MHLNAKPPVFVPHEFQDEIEQLSKAALMDMVWDYATQITGSSNGSKVLAEFRKRREIIMSHRRDAKSPLSVIKAQRTA